MTLLASESEKARNPYAASTPIQSRAAARQVADESELTWMAPAARHAFIQATRSPNERSLIPAHAPARVLLKLQEFWGLTDQEMRLICGLPIDEQQTVAQALVAFSEVVDVKRRLRSVMSIRSRLSALYGGDQSVEKRWLVTPWNKLQGSSPLALMASGDIEQLIATESALRELVGA